MPPSPSSSGRLHVETLITTSEIRRVEFRLDGELIEQDRRFPFAAGLDPEACRGGRRLEAIGFDKRGSEVARDTVLLEPGADAFSVSFGDVRRIDENGWFEVTADIRSPDGADVERVDFYRGSHYSGSVAAPPFRLRMPRCDEAPFLRAVAHSSDGRLVESVHMLDDNADTLSVNLVEIYAMVTDRRGLPVGGLDAAEFELLEAGVVRPIEHFSEGDAVPLSLALVIDSSSSMLESIDRAKRAASRFLTQVLDPGDEVLLVDFDHRPRLLEAATQRIEHLIEHFDDIEPGGASAVYDGIAFGLLRLEEADGRRALVVLTDGEDTGSRLTVRQCAHLARRAGVPTFVLRHAAPPHDRPSHHALALEELASSTGGAIYDIRGPSDLSTAYDAIGRQLRDQYLLTFEADRVLSPDELDTLSVRIADPHLHVRTILGGQVRSTE